MTIGLVQAGSDSGQLHRAFSELAERLKVQEMHFRKADQEGGPGSDDRDFRSGLGAFIVLAGEDRSPGGGHAEAGSTGLRTA